MNTLRMVASLVPLLVAASLFTAIACTDASTAPKSVASLPATAPKGEWRALVVDGSLELKTLDAAAWAPLAEGASRAGVRELRARGKGAELRLFDAGRELARLWLGAEGQLRLGETEQGVIVIELVRGEARFWSFDGERTRVLVRGELVPVGKRDVVLFQDEEARTSVQPVAQVPARVQWTEELGAGREFSGLGTLQRVGAGGDAPLQLASVKLQALQAGHQALVEVEHRFVNQEREVIEGVFRFPLPADAALVGLAMDVGGKLMEGELVERHKARETYEAIVDSMRDPALLEWEPGNVFKLRVFPIEPGQPKRVVVRYLAPLTRERDGKARLRVALGRPPLAGAAPSLSASFNGQVVHPAGAAFPSSSVLELVGAPLADAYATDGADGTFVSAVFQAPAIVTGSARDEQTSPRDVFVVMDTSRSSLEFRSLQLDAYRGLVATLGPEDRVKLASADLVVREHSAWLAPGDAQGAALDEVSELDADGASDFGAVLRHAARERTARGERAARYEVVYLGDATATWGVTSVVDLLALASRVEAPIHALVLGESANLDLLREVSAVSGGRLLAPRDPGEVRAWANFLGAQAGAARYTKVRVLETEGLVAYPSGERSLLPGERLPIVVRVPKGAQAPSALALVAQEAGRERRFSLPLTRVEQAPWIAERWAREHLGQLERSGAERSEVVALSLRHGVMSRHTAFLVLESEEAYRLHGIERKAKDAGDAPRISGADLESVSGQQASLSPDRLQPGDPEVQVPAPADARSVRVIFPFGEVKEAVYEPELRVWSVRFLVERGTPDGVYPVNVRVEHADGRIEMLQLTYVVDTQAPELTFELTRRGSRVYLQATQSSATLDALLREPGRSAAQTHALIRQFGKDAKRAELRLPDASVVPMTAVKLAEFRVELPAAWVTALERPALEGTALKGPALERPAEGTALEGSLGQSSAAPRSFGVLVWDKAGNLREVELALSLDALSVSVLAERTTVAEGVL